MKGNFIGGEWSGSASGRSFERHNPADTRELVAVAPESDAGDVAAAVAAVESGYLEWAAKTPDQRADVLNRAAAVLASRAEGLARELVREEGKTLAEARVEASRTPANLRFYAGEALRVNGETFPAGGDGGLVLTLREPVGVVAAITPWNFPLNIPSRKLAPALAAGNGVVYKPSEITPLLGQRLVEALLEAGLPSGAIALVHGGSEAGAALVADDRVGAVTFTGSTAVGRSIHQAMDPSRRGQLEMGGKNPVIVMEDADTGRAADLIARGAFGLTGQACTGTSRGGGDPARPADLLDRLVAAARSRTVGDGLTDGVDMGPLATAAQLAKIREHIETAIAAGAVLKAGDEPLPAGTGHGHFVRPAILTEVDRGSALARQEVFGPVVAVFRVGSFDEAIEVANDSEYGLSAGIVTSDLGRAIAFARRIDSGVVKVNQPTTGFAMYAPFGGVKSSSTQTFKEQAGETMMRFYTVDKTVYVTP